MSSPLKKITKDYAYPLWKWYLAGIVALAITNYVTLVIPDIAKSIVNILQSAKSITDIQQLALTMIGLGVFLIFIRTISRLMLFWPGRVIEAKVKENVLSSLIQCKDEAFYKLKFGDLISRGANDVGNVRALYSFAYLQFLNLFFLIIFAVWHMTSINGKLTIAALSPLLLMGFLGKYILPLMHKYSKIQQQEIAALTNSVTETFANIHSIKTQNLEKHFLDLSEDKNARLEKINIKLAAVRNFFWPLLIGLQNLSLLVVLFYGGRLVISNQISLGDILAFNMYIALLSFPLTAIGFVLGIYQRTRVSAKRLVEVLSLEKEKNVGNPPKDNAEIAIQVKELNFSYDSNTKVLQDISFELKAGQRLGIYGPIGSGKSTLLRMLSGLQKQNSGNIHICEQNIEDYSLPDLRKTVLFCQQESVFLSASIKENLDLGHDFDDHQRDKATEQAQLKRDISQFENGIDTQIGEHGYKLSGGQKQRLSLARTLLRSNLPETQIILLDDIFSALDHETEQLIIKEFDSIKHSTVIATHRSSILKTCDRVIFFDHDGRVIENTSDPQAISKRLQDIDYSAPKENKS